MRKMMRSMASGKMPDQQQLAQMAGGGAAPEGPQALTCSGPQWLCE